jgi:hypothetical protein
LTKPINKNNLIVIELDFPLVSRKSFQLSNEKVKRGRTIFEQISS